MTVNEQHYLTDPTGNVRFWPVRATAIDIAQLTADRDQLWAEAVALYRADVIPEPRSTEDRKLFAEVVGERVQTDPWETAIESALDARDDITVEEILTDVLDIAHRAQERKDQLRVVGILRRLGWERAPGRPTRDGKRVRLYMRMSPRPTIEQAAPRPLTLAEHAAWTALSTAGWTETVLPDGRRVWTQVDEHARVAEDLLQAV